MSPKQKAIKIFEKYCDFVELYVNPNAGETEANEIMDEFHKKVKKLSISVVDEILDFMILNLGWKENGNGNVDFWMEVKNEIQSL